MSEAADSTVRRLRRYSQYKKSVADWIGKVPAHWQVRKLKFCVDLINTKADYNEGDSEYIGLENIESWTGRRVHGGSVEPEGQPNSFASGDLLFGKLRPYLAKALLAESRGLCSSEILVLRPRAFCARYLLYWLLSSDFVREVDSSTYGAKMPRANWSFVGNLPAVLPEVVEQRAIGDFLDQETLKIGALVAKKERLIELLQEKRTAIITHAVTKGVGSNAPMKDSCTEWSGKVPRNWDLHKLGYLFRMVSGGTPSKDNAIYWRGAIPWVSPKDMKSRVISDSLDHVSDIALAETNLSLIPPPAVLIVVRGMILAHSFPVAITAVAVTINQDMKALLIKSDLLPDYLVYLLEGIRDLVLSNTEESGHGTKRLRTELWKTLKVYLPSLFEQQAICDSLRVETARIDRLIEKIGEGIKRLKEYRTALISAAVTGKIDVRESSAKG